MKSKFIKISRISLSSFAVALAILIGFAVFTEQQEISLPPALGVLLLVTGFLAIICIVVAWVLDLVDNYKRVGVSYIISYAAVVVVFGLVLMGIDYFIDGQSLQLVNSIGKAAVIVCGLRAGQYIFSK